MNTILLIVDIIAYIFMIIFLIMMIVEIKNMIERENALHKTNLSIHELNFEEISKIIDAVLGLQEARDELLEKINTIKGREIILTKKIVELKADMNIIKNSKKKNAKK